MNYIKITLVYFIALWMISCSTLSKRASEEEQLVSKKYSNEFKKALAFMEDQRFSLAIKGFQSILSQKIPSGPFKWSILFNIGSSYLLNKDCLDAKKTLQDLAYQTNNKYKFRGQVLLQLHYTHECLGETHQALAVLGSIEEENSQLSERVRQIEIPARYSILHASLGNRKQAFIYQDKALEGLKKIKQPIRDKKIVNELAAQSFYIMGRSFAHPSHVKLNHLLNALPYHQIYLSQSFLISEPIWTSLARKEINKLHEIVFTAYKKIPFNKKSLYKGSMMKTLNNFQKIANESQNTELKKILSHIVQQLYTVIK